jgi:hypothetical protein
MRIIKQTMSVYMHFPHALGDDADAIDTKKDNGRSSFEKRPLRLEM